MLTGHAKKPFQCPSCAFLQLEPPHLISTYCRACGDYYEVKRPGAATVSRFFPPAPILNGRRRDVFCHRCGTTHRVSEHARTTICGTCSAAIDLEDMSFLECASRPVDTRGSLLVGPGAMVSHSWLVCGSARIEGRVTGSLKSEGEVVLATTGSMVCQISAPSVVIEKGACVHVTLPVETDSFLVRGQFSGIVRSRGMVKVFRGGVLDADVKARSVVVEKGGRLNGNLCVDTTQASVASSPQNVQRAFSPLVVVESSAAG